MRSEYCLGKQVVVAEKEKQQNTIIIHKPTPNSS